MKKFIFLIVFILFTNIINSQIICDFGRKYNDTIPEEFNINIPKLREHIYAGIPNNLKTGINERRTFLFSDINACYISEKIKSGDIYSDWIPLENYLNEILKKVIPDELKNDTVIHIYLVQDGNFNASMTSSGHIFINIGLLAEVNNEATIAGILAHELAHYYLRHSLYRYIETEKGTFNMVLFKDKAKNRYSVKREIESDSLAMRWLRNSNYNIIGLKNCFETMERLDNNRLFRSEDKWELDETTHPLSGARLEKLNQYIEKCKTEQGQFFLVSKEDFLNFKEESKPEILKLLLYNFNYYTCIEKAFRFHIFDPDNITYIYYLMEAIRRNCYLNSTLWKEYFITNRYYDTLRVDGSRTKRKIDDNLFAKFNFNIIPIDVREAKYIKAKFYWKDKPKFTTYNEAFEFFYRVSQALNNPECILSNALSYTREKQVRDSLLKIYLGFENIKYRVLADNLLKDSVYQNLGKKKLLVFSNFETSVRQGKDEIPIRINSSDSTDDLSDLFDSIKVGYKDYIPIYLKKIKTNHLNEYKLLSELEDFSFRLTISKGEKTELHILDPRYIEIFLKYGINEIVFINCIYLDSRNAEETIDAYKVIMNSDYKTIFSQTKNTKFLETYITSVREINDGVMKIKMGHYKQFKNKESGLSQIIPEIKDQLTRKEKVSTERDIDYQNR